MLNRGPKVKKGHFFNNAQYGHMTNQNNRLDERITNLLSFSAKLNGSRDISPGMKWSHVSKYALFVDFWRLFQWNQQ